MKYGILVAVGISLAASHAHAWDYNQGGNHNQQIGDSATGYQANTTINNRASASAAAAAAANARASGGAGYGGAGGNASVVGGGGNTGNVNVGGGNSLGLVVPSIGGMASCGGGFSLGGIVSGGGGAGAAMWEFGDCKKEREAHTLWGMGQFAAAIALMCQIDAVRSAYDSLGQSCVAQFVMPPPPPVVVAAAPVPIPCHYPAFRDRNGVCHYPSRPRPIVHHDVVCHDVVVRECVQK